VESPGNHLTTPPHTHTHTWSFVHSWLPPAVRALFFSWGLRCNWICKLHHQPSSHLLGVFFFSFFFFLSCSLLQTVAQQIGIEKAHQMELLRNPHGLRLDLRDQEIILEVAEYVCRLRYCGHSGEDQARMARLASGLLPAAVVNNFSAVREEGDDGGNFTLYSAHDNTIMAMLAHLGFRNFPLPKFAAHLVFELHEIDGEHIVKVCGSTQHLRFCTFFVVVCSCMRAP
jgi:hypothetical protein